SSSFSGVVRHFKHVHGVFFFAQVSCINRLQHVDAQERGLQVTSVSWNCTGSVIGCGLTKAYVCMWNLNPKQPGVIIDVVTPVMCLCFHPLKPYVVALVLFMVSWGAVQWVWDTGRSQDLILAQTGMSADTHREPVYQVSWVPGARRVLLWTVDGAEAEIILSSGYALVQQQELRVEQQAKWTRASTNIGVTSVALSPWDLDTVLVGSEGGLVLKCTFSRDSGSNSLAHLHTLLQPRLVQIGQPTYCLEFNPKHTNLMAVGNADESVNIRQLSAELTEQGTRQMALLEQLANEVAD
uniref:Dynein 2 intermediate chain 2 n=1 Tax=Cyprinus carpio carpio TaxID=630221 RepID=A0A9J7Y2B2_CYPCA